MATSRGEAAVIVGVVVAVAGTFLPWLTSGSVDRSSYELLDLVERIGFRSDGVVDLALTLWPVVPLLGVLCVAGSLAGDRVPLPIRLCVWMVTGVYVGATAGAVLLAPDAGLVRIRFGAWVTAAGAVILLGGAVGELTARRRVAAQEV